MNKTRKIEIPRQQNMVGKRPKRCHLCKKSFAPDVYVSYVLCKNEHFENCYRFENKKIQDSRAKTQNKPVQNRITNNKTNELNKQASIKKDCMLNP